MRTSASLPVLTALRERIRRLEGGAAHHRTVLPFGIKAIDQHLPEGGLALGALHEVAGGSNGAIDGAASAFFTAGIAARTRGQVLWCVTRQDLFAPAFAQAGLLPERVLYLEAGDEPSVLACFEEGLRHRGLGAVVAEVARLSMTASRRLQLAAEGSGAIGIAIRRWRRQTEATDFGQPTAAVTRWRVSVLPSTPLPVPGVGRARWQLELIRCRAGESADFEVEACDAKGRLALPSNLATDRVRRKLGSAAPPADAPLVLIGREGRRRVVLAADAAAQRAGLRVGMNAAKAQALVPRLIVNNADPAADAEALDRLALWALRLYAPIAAADPPDGLVIDTTGAAHLHGGEDAMVNAMITRLAASGLRARAAIADGWSAAYAFARYAAQPVVIVPPGESATAILNLPIAALRLPRDMVESLRVLGFERIGELANTPRAPLTLRFGPELGRCLDQVMRLISEPIDPIRAPDLIEVREIFGEPIGAAETIARYIGKLVVQLCEMLEAKGLGAKRLDLLFHRVDNRIEAVRIGTALPVRDVRRLTRLLCDKIETVDPGFGIEIMRLAATLAEPLAPTQIISSLTEEPEADITDLIDTLANRVGEKRLYRFAPVASDVPERSVMRVDPAAPATGAVWPDQWPRPSRLLPTPEPIETVALLPDQPPVTFTWRGVRRRVKRADGPERVFGEWWKRDPELIAVRDYFQVEDEAGERFWIYRAGDGEDQDTGSHRWFLHGIFA